MRENIEEPNQTAQPDLNPSIKIMAGLVQLGRGVGAQVEASKVRFRMA